MKLFRSILQASLYLFAFAALGACDSNQEATNPKPPESQSESRLISSSSIDLRSDQISDIAKSITVLIETPSGSGSGVIIKRDGDNYTVATAWHVIKSTNPGEEISAKTHDGKFHNMSIDNARQIEDTDLALIDFSSQNNYKFPSIGYSENLSSGSKVFVAGFPIASSAVPIQLLRILKGDVIANSSAYINNGYQLLYTNPTLPGMSGGPVLDAKGNLVGVHGQAEIDTTLTQDKEIAVKTGTNQAIPISYLGLDGSSPKGSELIDPDEAKSASLIARSSSLMNQITTIEKEMDLDDRSDYIGKFQGNPLITELAKESMRLLDKAILVKPSSHAYYLRALHKSSGNGMYKHLAYSPDSILSDLDSSLELNPDNAYALTHKARVIRSDWSEKMYKIKDDYVQKRFLEETGRSYNDESYQVRVDSAFKYEDEWHQDSSNDTSFVDNILPLSLSMRAINSDPYYIPAYAQFCETLLWPSIYRGRQCVDILSKGLSLSPGSSVLHLYRGKALSAMASAINSQLTWEKSKDAPPQTYRERQKLSLDLQRQAINAFAKAISLDPSNSLALTLSQLEKKSIGDYLGAAKDLTLQIKMARFPNSVNFYLFDRARAYYMAEGHLDEERNDYLAILASHSPAEWEKIEAALGLMDVSRRSNDSEDVCKYLSMVDRIHLRTGKTYGDFFGTFKKPKDRIDIKKIKLSEEFCGKRLSYSFWN